LTVPIIPPAQSPLDLDSPADLVGLDGARNP